MRTRIIRSLEDDGVILKCQRQDFAARGRTIKEPGGHAPEDGACQRIEAWRAFTLYAFIKDKSIFLLLHLNKVERIRE